MHTAELDTAATPTTTVWRMPSSNLDIAAKIIERVNRRCKRNGLPLYTVTTEVAELRPVYDDELQNGWATVDGKRVPARNGVPLPVLYFIEYLDVTVHGEVPRLGDWEPVAVITRDPEAGVITRPWPGTEADLSALRGRADTGCDHCGKDRARIDTFAVRNTVTGELRQVGRNCLAAFTGIVLNLAAATWTDSATGGMEELCSGGGSEGDQRTSVAYLMQFGVVAMQMFGWRSRKDAQYDRTVTATSDVVRSALFGRDPGSRKLREAMHGAIDAQVTERAAAVIDYAKTMDREDTSEYATNVAALARCNTIATRNIGMLVSAVSALAKEEERRIRKAKAGESTWQGEVDKRQVFAGLTVTSVYVTSNYTGMGTKDIVKFVDDAGNRFTWFASGNTGLEVGQRVDVTGTVKKHSEWQGIKETQLNRCKCAVVAEAPAEA